MPLLLGHWYEIMALYYVKSILTEISASRQDRRVLQKSKIIRIEFLSKWGMLQTSRYVQNSRNLEKTILTEISQCTAVLYSDWSLQMGQMGPKMTQGTLTMSGDEFPGVQGVQPHVTDGSLMMQSLWNFSGLQSCTIFSLFSFSSFSSSSSFFSSSSPSG